MISPKEQEPEQDQPQQFGGKSPGNLDLEVSPPVIVNMLSLNHARFPYALQMIDRSPSAAEHLYQLFRHRFQFQRRTW
jgi:hypothetical protein